METERTCSKLIHRGGKYVRLDNGHATRCLTCGEDIDDIDLPGMLLT